MRILIYYKSTIRKFLALETGERDGSLIITVRRDGSSEIGATWTTRLKGSDAVSARFEATKAKNKRITVHQSGRVNYHENGKSIYIAPLTQTDKTFQIYRYRVPAIDRLESHDREVAAEDLVWDLSDMPEQATSFSILIATVGFEPQPPAVKLSYEAEGYSVVVLVESSVFAVPDEYRECFVTLTPENGLFDQQRMAEDQAMIAFHQALNSTSGQVVYAPNGEGVIRLIFAAPKRIAPRFRIKLADSDLYVSDQDVQTDARSDKVMLRFKVRRKSTGQVIRQGVEIRSIELDAEL